MRKGSIFLAPFKVNLSFCVKYMVCFFNKNDILVFNVQIPKSLRLEKKLHFVGLIEPARTSKL